MLRSKRNVALEFASKKLDGLVDVTFDPAVDHRGYLIKPYDEKPFKEKGINVDWKQILLQFTENINTVKGFHFQAAPFTEAKLITPINGKVIWVCVDVRPGSPTFGEVESTMLSSKRNSSLYACRGFAHANMNLTAEARIIIAADNHYSEAAGVGFAWDDPDIGFKWPLIEGEAVTMKEEHRDNPPFANIKNNINLEI